MEDKQYFNTIAKLVNAVIILSLTVIGLLILIVSIYSFDTDTSIHKPQAFCGTVSPPRIQPGCANYISPEAMNLFRNNCASCHFLDKDMTGPALKGAGNRGPYENWIRDFLTNEDSLVTVEEPYTIALKSKWYEIAGWNHNYDYFTEEDWQLINEIVY